MSAHTPAPWTFRQRTCDDFEGSIAYVKGDSGHIEVAVLYSDERQTANARLIAASPDLLEAARHAAMEWRLHASLTDSCRVLEAAIAKAEGRQS